MERSTPREEKYRNLKGRGVALVEVLALTSEIKDWLEKGYPLAAIFRMYCEEQKLAGYTFNTFRRAILKAGLKEKRPSKASKNTQQKPTTENNPVQRPRPHEMARPKQQQFLSLSGSGVDHIGLDK